MRVGWQRRASAQVINTGGGNYVSCPRNPCRLVFRQATNQPDLQDRDRGAVPVVFPTLDIDEEFLWATRYGVPLLEA
jgi:hypothetical protein